ncbi:formyltransferase family protein [Halodesulfovibrio aestuarii]|uniref:Methionyl-tRNA formyltransferase n=1 Tax=Halodesulfovibrio aestuarii TaxID=126333 RepID=A0A8G2C802_9BACT|nr:formyltransferase family protein [Halodesulfovibrio aestuarii]SHI73516.1 methionyl-tRNA formyltransferase [Halodesulfovibrio aestuarii]
MRVIIIGQGWLAAEVLKKVNKLDGVQVIAISPEKRNDHFEKLANELGVMVVAALEELPECDVVLAAHCHCFVSKAIRSKATHGVLAYHPSLLPRHRGRDAIHWTLAMKDPIAGGTVYKMDDGADTGGIIIQDWCHVAANDTPQLLWRRALAPMGVHLLTSVVQKLASTGQFEAKKQDEIFATWEPSLTRKMLSNIT